MAILLSGLQNRVKNSAAYAEELGLMLISNGEEMPYLLSPTGEIIPAGLDAPTDVPVVSDAGSGSLTNGKYVIYTAVYVSENSFPLVAAKILSNPSEFTAPYHITGSGDRTLSVAVEPTDAPLVSHIYIYRTAPTNTADLAQVAADAGLMNYVGKLANTGSTTLEFEDDNLTVLGNEVLERSNFTVPQFRFCVWDGAYFWGFGNHPFTAEAVWNTDGEINLSNSSVDKFYGGRNDQFITFDGISTGGIDNRGTYLFKQTGDYVGQAILEDGSDATLPSTASGQIVIIGPSATLYRSGYRNPFQWGYYKNIAGIYIPSLWEYKVAGSLGTAIAILPDQQLLKLDMEFPALCLTFSLQASGTDVFSQTRRQVSKTHSTTSHFSQFPAVSKGRQVLWSMDYKNLAILECDGYNQIPVSGPVSILLRKLSQNRSLHLLSHGIYDPTIECNLMWLSTANVDSGSIEAQFDICIYQHTPTGFWGIIRDYGVLCSAPVEDPITSRRTTLIGTENGFLGRAFDLSTYGNWLPSDSPLLGNINYANEFSIRRSEGQDDFNPIDAGLIGNFCTITDPNGLRTQIRKIVGATSDTLVFDKQLDPIPSYSDETGLEDSQWKFFIGLNELRMLKYFDGGVPSIDKATREYWATLSDAEDVRIEFFPEHTETPSQSIQLKQDSDLDAWFSKLEFPTKKKKTFGLGLVERSHNPTKFFNFTLT